MSKNSVRLWVLISASSLLTGFLTSCDRGANDEIAAAHRFADAVVRNNATARDTMIATARFKSFFENDFVAHDLRLWFGTFYNYQQQAFRGTATADVERDLHKDLDGNLLDTTEIEETGMVKVKSGNPADEAAYFWMVHQRGKPWRIAVVTKGETAVNFR